MATFAGKCYVAGYDATRLLSSGCVNCRRMSAERQLATTIYSLRTCVENLVSQILEKAENVAFRSMSRMQSGPNSGSPNSESGMADGRWHPGEVSNRYAAVRERNPVSSVIRCQFIFSRNPA